MIVVVCKTLKIQKGIKRYATLRHITKTAPNHTLHLQLRTRRDRLPPHLSYGDINLLRRSGTRTRVLE